MSKLKLLIVTLASFVDLTRFFPYSMYFETQGFTIQMDMYRQNSYIKCSVFSATCNHTLIQDQNYSSPPSLRNILEAEMFEESCQQFVAVERSTGTIFCSVLKKKKQTCLPGHYEESNIQALINGKVIRAEAWKHVTLVKEWHIIKNF